MNQAKKKEAAIVRKSNDRHPGRGPLTTAAVVFRPLRQSLPEHCGSRQGTTAAVVGKVPPKAFKQLINKEIKIFIHKNKVYET